MLIPYPLVKPAAIAGYAVGLYVLLHLFLADPAQAGGNSGNALQQQSFVEQILQQSAGSTTPGVRITSISSHFLSIPYLANSLIGGPAEAEQLVTRMDGFDCFTFLDTVEALRRSTDESDFPKQMIQVRYRGGVVSYANRRHFFSDWVSDKGSPVKDVTALVGQGGERRAAKTLNLKIDGALWVQGVDVVSRTIPYIPADQLNEMQLDALESGDYVGVFSPRPGLDVSHTGLIVKADEAVLLRHASSRGGVERIIDEDLLTYLRGKTGLVVYRVVQ